MASESDKFKPQQVGLRLFIKIILLRKRRLRSFNKLKKLMKKKMMNVPSYLKFCLQLNVLHLCVIQKLFMRIYTRCRRKQLKELTKTLIKLNMRKLKLNALLSQILKELRKAHLMFLLFCKRVRKLNQPILGVASIQRRKTQINSKK